MGPSICASRNVARSASCSPWPRETQRRRWPGSRPAGWPTRARRWPRWRSWPRRSACRVHPSGSSATTSATSRAANRSAAWSCSRTASRVPASTGGSRSRRSPARTTSPATRRSCAVGSASPGPGEEGVEEARRWAMPDLVIVDGGKGQVSAAKAVLDELGLHDLPLAGLAKEREELFLPGRDRADPPARDVAGALPRPAPARRGPSVRHHLSPRPARTTQRPVRVRRPARRRPEAQARADEGVRFDQARARCAGRADRRGPRYRAVARGQDQGDAGGLTGRTR